MALMERVATLLRADVKDLIARAEDPEKMIRQLLLDMENQLLQVKTKVAIALADQHLLERKTREGEEVVAGWHRKAELAVGKGDDALARAALERAVSQEATVAAFREQVVDQTAEAEALRASYGKLQGKLFETQTRCETLMAQHRRTRLVSKAAEARISQFEVASQAGKSLGEDSLESRLAKLETEERVEQLLAALKGKQSGLLAAG